MQHLRATANKTGEQPRWSSAVIYNGRSYQIRLLGGRVAQILEIQSGGEREPQCHLVWQPPPKAWSYWEKAPGVPGRSDELEVRGVRTAQGEKTDKKRGRKHFRYPISHWTYPNPAKQFCNVQMSVGRLILLVMRLPCMNDTTEVPYH